jgi:hypothetical protein
VPRTGPRECGSGLVRLRGSPSSWASLGLSRRTGVHDDCPRWGTDPWSSGRRCVRRTRGSYWPGTAFAVTSPSRSWSARQRQDSLQQPSCSLYIYIVTILGQSEAEPAAVPGAIDHRALIQQRAEVRTRTRPDDQLPNGVAPEHDLAASNDAHHRLRTPDGLGAGAARSASGLAAAAQ